MSESIPPCTVCALPVQELLTVVDDGDKYMSFCANDLLRYFLNMLNERFYDEALPSRVSVMASCDLCKNKAIYFQDARDRFNVCLPHAKELTLRRLSPEHFHVLHAKHPGAHLLHDDFYDPETGEALQALDPVDYE